MPTLNDMDCLPIVERARRRFEARLLPQNDRGCCLWSGGTDKHGYGTICVLPINRQLKTHRLAWVLGNRVPIPDGLDILHSCDTPGCCSPEHLRPGTQAQNCADAFARGRSRGGHGEGHRNAKLTWELVGQIRTRRAAGESCASLAREFGVGRDQISRICTGKVWTAPGTSGPAQYRRRRKKVGST